MEKSVLIINSGSSSLKYSLFNAETNEAPVEGLAERLNEEGATLKWVLNGEKTSYPLSTPEGLAGGHAEALTLILKLLNDQGLLEQIVGIGHRVVHGAEYFDKSVIIDADVINKIRECSRLAPLHNPAHLLGIELLLESLPSIPQVATFDTAFHQTMPKEAYLYPLPYKLYKEHSIRRYGFHGTSHLYVSHRAIELCQLDKENSAVITLHLGNGCSATAVKNGKSIDTSMGLTPLEGLMMGTRCGDIDPSILQFLGNDLKLEPTAINELLNKKSGLLGLSELSNDMRTLIEASEDGNEKATVAIEVFCYRLAKYIAALAVTLGRIDAVVFTGGIGENAALIRSKTLARLALLGLKEDSARNQASGKQSDHLISPDGAIPVLVIPTQEELMIAKDTISLVSP